MNKIKNVSLILITLAMQATLLQTAYAEKTYQANVVKGDVVLKINETSKEYKKGASITLKSGSMICYQSGNGKVKIPKLKKRLTEKSPCQITPREKCKSNTKCNPSPLTITLAKIKNMRRDGGTGSIAGANTRGGGNASEKTKTHVNPITTSIKLINLNGDKYVYIENTAWTANRHTLPITLEVITDLKTQETKDKKYTSNSMGTIQFLIPWAEIEDKNNPTQSHHLTIQNKRNNVLMKPIRVIK